MGSETYRRTGNTNAFLTHPGGAGPELFKLNQEQWYNVYVVYILLYAATASAAKSLQLCPTLCDPIDGSPPGSPIPGILQTRTGVGCHFLLQCMKVKTESEVAQSCPILSDPMDPSRLLHPWDFPGKSTRVGCHCLLWFYCIYSMCFSFSQKNDRKGDCVKVK